MEKRIPPFLKQGDKVSIISTARKIDREIVEKACVIFDSKGLIPEPGKSLFNAYHQYAGSDKERAEDLQNAIDDPEIKAIFCARGGYGTVRLLDIVNWKNFQLNPKWICGYSDVTALHARSAFLGVASLHSTMPINYANNPKEIIDRTFDSLFGKGNTYSWESKQTEDNQECCGVICGGNLSVIYSLLGSADQLKTKGRILFLEDLDEYLYHIDRMMMALKRAGLLSELAGLVVGGMTDMNDNEVPFGKNPEEIIHEAVKDYNYPVFFDFPSGHIDNNNPIIMGKEAQLRFKKGKGDFSQ